MSRTDFQRVNKAVVIRPSFNEVKQQMYEAPQLKRMFGEGDATARIYMHSVTMQNSTQSQSDCVPNNAEPNNYATVSMSLGLPPYKVCRV
jgi:hypothetical protein